MAGAEATSARHVTTGGFARNARQLFSVTRSDWLAIGLLVAVPILLYVPLVISGRVILPGDDLVQNFPLRVLSGEVIRSGRLPTWDPLIWSGTPLLAGWNAGAMFPGTLAFAVIPAVAAWTLNVVFAPACCGIGTYLFLRQLRCRPIAGLMGALVFTYTGFMSGQVVHIGLIQGTALTPWCLVALEQVTRNRSRMSALVGIAIFGAAFAGIVLAGDPRAVTSAAIISGIYALSCCVRAGRAAPALIAEFLLGLGLGVGLSAIQLLPGIGFLRASQRGTSALSFFGTGSFEVPHLVTLMVLPFLLGGNRNFDLPIYQGPYNLPEITIGVGFVALLAGLAFIPTVLSSLYAWIRRRVRDTTDSHRLGVWYLLIAFGVVLSLGTTIPTGRLLVKVPLFGLERLQNRNAVLFDLALSVLLAFFVNDLTGRTSQPSKSFAKASRKNSDSLSGNVGDLVETTSMLTFRPKGALEDRVGRFLCLVPFAVTASVLGYALVSPRGIEARLHVPHFDPGLFSGLVPYLVASFVICTAVTAFTLFQHRLCLKVRTWLLLVFLICDVGIYVANASYASTPSSELARTTALTDKVSALIGKDGRFAVYDPAFVLPAANSDILDQVGVTDLNILHNQSTVQGYGSIVNGVYQNFTDTHSYEGLNPQRLAGETFNTLDLKALLTLPSYLYETIPAHSAIPVAGAGPVTATGLPGSTVDAPAPPPFSSGPYPIKSGKAASFTFGATKKLVRATVVMNPVLGGGPSSVAVSAVRSDKVLQTVVAPVVNGQAHVYFSKTETTDSIRVTDPSPKSGLIGSLVAVTTSPDLRLLMDGSLQNSVVSPHWRFVGNVGPFLSFVNSDTAGISWLQPSSSITPDVDSRAPGWVKVLTNSATAPERLLVNAPKRAVLVRSEGYSVGWKAELRPTKGGHTKVVNVHRFGLVQAITVPRGTYVVTFKYVSKSITVGLVVSLISLAVLLTLVMILFLYRKKAPPNI